MLFAALHESASGPKRTSQVAPHMSAFGGKADMTGCECPLSRSLLGVKRTWPIALHMSAYDPKRTSGACARSDCPSVRDGMINPKDHHRTDDCNYHAPN